MTDTPPGSPGGPGTRRSRPSLQIPAPGRASYMSPALALSVDGAVPLEFRDIDLRDRPDHPDNKFNLAVMPGETIAAVGDEDSGVGDLGRFALGLLRPISGTTYVFGKVIAELPYYDLLVFRRRLGYLQTGDGLLQNLTLRDNIALPLRYASDHRASEVDGRVAELIAEFDLERVALLRPAAANEEDRRRCALARAVALDPDLLVLEAPFDGLTQATAVELLGLANARADGTERSVLITAQDLAPTLRPLLTRVVRVSEGMAVTETL